MLKESIESKIERVRNMQDMTRKNIKLVAQRLTESSERVANGDFLYLDEVKSRYEWLQEQLNDLNRYKELETVYKDILKNEVYDEEEK